MFSTTVWLLLVPAGIAATTTSGACDDSCSLALNGKCDSLTAGRRKLWSAFVSFVEETQTSEVATFVEIAKDFVEEDVDGQCDAGTDCTDCALGGPLAEYFGGDDDYWEATDAAEALVDEVAHLARSTRVDDWLLALVNNNNKNPPPREEEEDTTQHTTALYDDDEEGRGYYAYDEEEGYYAYDESYYAYDEEEGFTYDDYDDDYYDYYDDDADHIALIETFDDDDDFGYYYLYENYDEDADNSDNNKNDAFNVLTTCDDSCVYARDGTCDYGAPEAVLRVYYPKYHFDDNYADDDDDEAYRAATESACRFGSDCTDCLLAGWWDAPPAKGFIRDLGYVPVAANMRYARPTMATADE